MSLKIEKKFSFNWNIIIISRKYNGTIITIFVKRIFEEKCHGVVFETFQNSYFLLLYLDLQLGCQTSMYIIKTFLVERWKCT